MCILKSIPLQHSHSNSVISIISMYIIISYKHKAAKGEGWAPPFISCAQDTVGI